LNPGVSFSAGGLVDLALGVLVVEAICLAFFYRRDPARLLPWFAGLASGGALLLALRAALAGANWTVIGVCMILALVSHGLDGWFRLRSGKV
jgi:hypothetical protein